MHKKQRVQGAKVIEPGSWGVVCTADEPLQLLCAFALHHRAVGAREVHLFLDTPRLGYRETLERIDGVIVHECDGAARKPSIEKRQLKNAHTAMTSAGVDWLAHVDSDEFISPEAGREIGALLAGLRDEVDYVSLPIRERAYAGDPNAGNIFCGGTVAPYDVAQDVATPTTALARRAIFAGNGLLAHTSGKSITRTDRPLLVGIHRPRPSKDHPDKYRKRQALAPYEATEAAVLHFDGLTPFHWAAKLWRMARFMPDQMLEIQEPGRQALIRHARRTLPDVGPIHDIAREVRHLDDASVAALCEAGVWRDVEIDPAALVVEAGLFPEAAFSTEAFDAALIEMYPQYAEFREES